MANDAKPAFIDLTEVFNTTEEHGWGIFTFITFGEAASKEVTVEVGNIAKLEDTRTGTHIITKTGFDIYVQEIRDEVKKKIAAALNP